MGVSRGQWGQKVAQLGLAAQNIGSTTLSGSAGVGGAQRGSTAVSRDFFSPLLDFAVT